MTNKTSVKYKFFALLDIIVMNSVIVHVFVQIADLRAPAPEFYLSFSCGPLKS